MSTEKHNTTEQSPASEWKPDPGKYWRAACEKSQLHINHIKMRFSTAQIYKITAGCAALAWVASGIYWVEDGSRGVESRFGEYENTTHPGLHWHFPTPLGHVDRIDVNQQRLVEIGFAAANSTPKSYETLFLTKDANLVSAPVSVQYTIKNAHDYQFNVRNSYELLKQLTESIGREVIARNDKAYVSSQGRGDINNEIQSVLQATLDSYQAGIQITQVSVRDIKLPEDVQTAFDDEARAHEEKQRLINQAGTYRDETLPKAKNAAIKLIHDAELYEAEKIALANNETERFEQVLNEYQKSPAITRKRLLLETQEKLLSIANKVIVDADTQAPQFMVQIPHAPSTQPLENKNADGDPVEGQPSPQKNQAVKNGHSSIRPSRSKS